MTAPARLGLYQRRYGLDSREIGPLATALCTAFIVALPISAFGAIAAVPARFTLAFTLPAFAALLLAPKMALLRLPVFLPLVLLAAWMTASLWWTRDPERTMFLLRSDLALLAGVVIVSGLLSFERLAAAVVWAVRFGLAVTVVAILVDPNARTMIQPDGFELPGWRGWFLHKNSMAIFLALGLGTVLALDRSTRSRRASVAVILVLILGARSATGLAVTIMVLVAWYVLVEYRARTGRWSVGYLAAAGAILLSVAGVTLSNAATIVGWFGRDMTLTGRTGIWAAVVPSIIENPILGYGRGGLFFTMNPDTVEILRRVHFTAYHAHSGVLDLLLQLGLVGLVLTAAVYGTMFVLGLQSPTRLGLWMALLFVGQVSVSLSEATLVMPHVIWPAMTITAMLRLEQEQPGWAPVTRWTNRAA